MGHPAVSEEGRKQPPPGSPPRLKPGLLPIPLCPPYFQSPFTKRKSWSLGVCGWEQSTPSEICSPACLYPGVIPTFSLSALALSHQVILILPPIALESHLLQPASTLGPCSRPPGMSFYCPCPYGLLTHLLAPIPVPANHVHPITTLIFLSQVMSVPL